MPRPPLVVLTTPDNTGKLLFAPEQIAMVRPSKKDGAKMLVVLVGMPVKEGIPVKEGRAAVEAAINQARGLLA